MANPVCDVLLTEVRLDPGRGRVRLSAGRSWISGEWSVRLKQIAKLRELNTKHIIPMAEHQLRLIAQVAAERFALDSVIIHHRLGFVRGERGVGLCPGDQPKSQPRLLRRASG